MPTDNEPTEDFNSIEPDVSLPLMSEEPEEEPRDDGKPAGDQHPDTDDGEAGGGEPGGTNRQDGAKPGEKQDDSLPQEAEDGQRVLAQDGQVMLRQDGKWIPERTVSGFHMAEDVKDSKGNVLVQAGDYDRKVVEDAMVIAHNVKEFNKANTERSMEVAAGNRRIAAIMDYVKLIQKDALQEDGSLKPGSYAESLYKDLLDNEGKEMADKFLQDVVPYDPSKFEDTVALENQRLQADLTRRDADRRMNDDKKALRELAEQKHGIKLTDEELTELEEFAIEKMDDPDQPEMISIETAYFRKYGDKFREMAQEEKEAKEEKEKRQLPLPDGAGGVERQPGEPASSFDDLRDRGKKYKLLSD